MHSLLRALISQIGKEPWLAATGGLGVLLAIVLVLAALLRGVAVPPEGNLLETATFDGAVGIFTLTLAALAPLVSFSPRGRRAWVGTLVVTTLYSYGIETVQACRGLDPRFSRVAGPADRILGGTFLLAALVVMTCFSILAVKFFRRPAAPMDLAVRYGAIAAWLAFLVGIWMSVVTTGRRVGAAGNLLPLHAAGFHGLQALPLVALLLAAPSRPPAAVRTGIHLAGVLWLALCLAIAAQSFAGRALGELSPATALALLCAGSFVVVVAAAARAASR